MILVENAKQVGPKNTSGVCILVRFRRLNGDSCFVFVGQLNCDQLRRLFDDQILV